MDYEMTIYFRQKWKDENWVGDYSRKLAARYFTLGTFLSFFIGRQKIVLIGRKRVKGIVKFSERITLTVSCYMDLAFYPFDYQTCPIHLVMVLSRDLRTVRSQDDYRPRMRDRTKTASFGFPAGQLKLSWNNKGNHANSDGLSRTRTDQVKQGSPDKFLKT